MLHSPRDGLLFAGSETESTSKQKRHLQHANTSVRTDCRLSVQCDFIIASGSLRASKHEFCSVSSLQSCIVAWDLQYKLRIFVVSPQRNDRSVSISMMENGLFSGWFLVSLQRNRCAHASFLHASFGSVFAVKVETLPLR